MRRTPLAIAAFVAILGCAAIAGANTKRAVDPPKIEAVFVLDTTGSMGGLINAAKEKIWAIANNLADTEPAPFIKMGLVGYRDRGDAYVTRITELTENLDAVYGDLMAFQAGGGGDTPESVNQALNEAVTRIAWSGDEETYRVIYLVGDSPPHMNYQQDVKYPKTCDLAVKAGIIINTIQCGTRSTTTPIWQDIAVRTEGSFFRVEQSGGAILATTPFDKEMAELSRELDETRVFYGKGEVAVEQAAKLTKEKEIYQKGSESALARRAVFNSSLAGSKNFLGKNELIDDVANGRAQLEALDGDALPEEMQKMSPEERVDHVEKLQQKRAELKTRIQELAAQREIHIKQQIKKHSLDEASSLDAALYQTLKSQAAKKGILYGEAMSH